MDNPQIQASAISNQLQINPALIGAHFDFSLIKVIPPSEYCGIGQSLSLRRKREADEGQFHTTAAKLGVLFSSVVPDISNLIGAYGSRCSEIANSPTFNPKGTSQHGMFASEVGADGTTIWAAATSGTSAIAVHLLACMLSRMWDPPEAISIWMELIAVRKQVLASSGNLMDYAASQISLTRDQIASWHTSALAWRLTADQAKARQQSQLLLIIDNLGIPVSGKKILSDSVLEAWKSAMITVDNLIAGKPQSVQTGAPLLGLASWHLYPDMIVYNQPKEVDVRQHDPLIHRGGIMTLGIQDTRRVGDGIYWSLPLAHFRYYGEPVNSEGRLSTQTSRVSIDELVFVALGSLIRRWCADADDIELAAKLINQLDTFIKKPDGLREEYAWLSLLGSKARDLLNAEQTVKADILQFIKGGRRRFPSFIDHPGTDSIFGLSNPNTLLKLMPSNAERISLLRFIAKDFGDDRNLMVVQCKGGLQTQWELASVEKFTIDGSPRYLRWFNRRYEYVPAHSIQGDSEDIRLDDLIPSLWAPKGYLWKHVPGGFYDKLLEEESDDSDWRGARDVSVFSRFAFGDPDIAALYVLSINYWTVSPNVSSKTVGQKTYYRDLPNIVILRHVSWALQEKLLSQERLSEYVVEGNYSTRDLGEYEKKSILVSLRALVTVWNLYKHLSGATVEQRVAGRPLAKHQWIPQTDHDPQSSPFGVFDLTREETFACIARFEAGHFNFHSSAMKGVMAISSGNSIYVAYCLLQDPTKHDSPALVQRVVGNVGKSGMTMLVSPSVPRVRPLTDDVRLVNHNSFDGSEQDCFGHTTLHLSFTEWQFPIDTGSRGNRDVEAYYIEAAIGVYDRGEWVADVNILDVFNNRLSCWMGCCDDEEHQRPLERGEISKFVCIDRWEELLDSPLEIGVVRARGNWQARLAAAAVSLQLGHETRIMSEQNACWGCWLAMPKMSREDNKEQDEDEFFIDDVISMPSRPFDEEDSDSDMDEFVIRDWARRNNKRKKKDDEHESTLQRDDSNRNIVYIF